MTGIIFLDKMMVKFILENPNPNRELRIAINSNLGVPDKLLDKFIEKVSKICDENRVKEFIVFTSCDTWGEQAEYIRHGLEFNRFWDNVNKLMTQCPRVNLTFMSTYNALSISNYDKLIEIATKKSQEIIQPTTFTTGFYNMLVTVDYSYVIEKMKSTKEISNVL